MNSIEPWNSMMEAWNAVAFGSLLGAIAFPISIALLVDRFSGELKQCVLRLKAIFKGKT